MFFAPLAEILGAPRQIIKACVALPPKTSRPKPLPYPHAPLPNTLRSLAPGSIKQSPRSQTPNPAAKSVPHDKQSTAGTPPPNQSNAPRPRLRARPSAIMAV